MPRCAFSTMGLRVRTTIPSVTGVEHAVIGPFVIPSTSTKHVRQAPTGPSFV